MPQLKTTPARRAAADLIDAVVDNMRQNLEELKYATLAPSRYTVYLSPAEYGRLEGILPRLQQEAARALDEELAKRNRPSWLRRRAAWLPGRHRAPLENAGSRWHIEFLSDSGGELAEDGDIVVHSELVLPADPELGVGERTRRITTSRQSGRESTREEIVSAPEPVRTAVHARLRYRDHHGEHEYDVVRDQTTIGRGGLAYPVDVRVASSEDVSREHARLRRDPATGAFFVIDLSTLGTTLNGRHVPRGVDVHDGAKRETGAETALPDRARIGLAGTIFIDFERVPS
jgi:hypothetical protein